MPDERPSLTLPPIWRLTGAAAGVAAFLAMLGLPAPAEMPPAAWRVAAVLVLMGVWWVTEAVPIAATALLPIILFPVLGVSPIETVVAPYAHPLIFLLLGGLLIGKGMQSCGLHRRIALAITRAAGRRADLLVGGFMAATALLSMWISNTATAAMMLPVALSVLSLIATQGDPLQRNAESRLTVALLLGVAFGANIGGIGTIIGTPPNAVLVAYMSSAAGIEITFAKWMAVGMPLAGILLVTAWSLLTRVVCPVRDIDLRGVGVLLARERIRLGRTTRAEKRFLLVFSAAVAAWLLQPVASAIVPELAITDTGIAIVAALALFLTPSGSHGGSALLTWDEAKDIPWGILLLIGGGLSLGTMIEASGLAHWVGASLTENSLLPTAAAVLAAATLALLVSHVMSNTAAAATLVPLTAAVAAGFGESPLLFAAPVVFATSCAFMLPVATPPNAIVYGSGRLSTWSMIRAGALLSLAALPIILGAAYLFVPSVWGSAGP